MSLSILPPSTVSYDGNNSTVTPYTVAFPFPEKSHLAVTVTRPTGLVVPLFLTIDYTVTGEGNPSGGTVKTKAAWDGTHKVTITRSIPLDQTFSYAEGQRIPMKTLESNFDRIVMQVQGVWNRLGTYAAALATHVSNISNPHAVTKAQVGLGNVDDTRDLDKPISNDTAAALAGKADIPGLSNYAMLDQEQIFEGRQSIFYSGTSGVGLTILPTDEEFLAGAYIFKIERFSGGPSENLFTVNGAGDVVAEGGITAASYNGITLGIDGIPDAVGQLMYDTTVNAWRYYNDETVVELAGRDNVMVFLNKSINLASNTLSGNMAQFDAAASNGNFAWQGGAAGFTTLDASGVVTLNNNVTLGSSATQTILPTARFSGSLVPNANNARDLGSTSLRWRDLSLSRDALIGGTLSVAGQTELSASQAASTGASAVSRDLMRGSYAELAADHPLATTTLTDINGLTLSLPAGTYQLTGTTIASPANSAMGVKISLSIAGTGNIFGFNTYYNSTTSQTIPYTQAAITSLNDARQTNGGVNGQPGVSEYNCILKVTSGTAVVKMQFAQHTSDAASLTAKAGSYLRAVKIAG